MLLLSSVSMDSFPVGNKSIGMSGNKSGRKLREFNCEEWMISLPELWENYLAKTQTKWKDFKYINQIRIWFCATGECLIYFSRRGREGKGSGQLEACFTSRAVLEEWLGEALTRAQKAQEWTGNAANKRFALLAFPACQGDGICAVLKRADAKDSFKTGLEEWLQELSFLISFDPN